MYAGMFFKNSSVTNDFPEVFLLSLKGDFHYQILGFSVVFDHNYQVGV